MPATPLWQLFVYDPNGVQLELTFHAAAESEDAPVIAPERLYKARERWFDPSCTVSSRAPEDARTMKITRVEAIWLQVPIAAERCST